MNKSIQALGMLMVVALLVFASSCHSPSKNRTTVVLTNQPAKMPPGQAKKVYGHQSAKAFAPGQQKNKKGTTVVVSN